jgi:hypothetical protein
MLARMKPRAPDFQDIPLGMIGGSTFGRYPLISVAQLYNMIISDQFLVDFSGYSYAITDMFGNPIPLNGNGVGRGIYRSTTSNIIIAVVFNGVYLITPSLSVTLIFSLSTYTGDVFIAEDIQGHIAVCDKTAIWIYTKATGVAQLATSNGGPLNFVPGYIAFQNGRFISVDLSSSQWRLSNPLYSTPNTDFPTGTQFVGGFQTKPDIPVAAFPFPGRGNLLFVMGSTVTEIWQDQGLALFPYVRSSGVDIDYGCLNSDTIAFSETFCCWLGANEKSGPAILVSTGGPPEQLSTDGINYKLQALTTPGDSHGFIFKQDGHILYVLTFPTDNFSICYDFMTKQFSTLTDEELNYFIAKRVAYFNNSYYFVSLNDGNLYEMSDNDTTYVGTEIPRIRICPTIRMPNMAPFVVNNLVFNIEQGYDNEPNLPVVDLAASYDGGYVFSNYDRMVLNPQGYRKNRFIYYNMGWGNQFTPMIRFYSTGRFVVGEGTASIYQ